MAERYDCGTILPTAADKKATEKQTATVITKTGFFKDGEQEANVIELVDLKKSYTVSEQSVPVLKGINLAFRESEMVAILGQSGCGKTTLLNVVGGLDHVFEGDIIVDGKSTQHFTDGDWDAYRNSKVGFVFQNYNLITHLSVLENVEIALTMSGVSKAQRRKKATLALERVGLGDHLHKRPNQLSGGQMQRVSIARALINDPRIILADEPTGALDSETSVAVMDILKEISRERLVVLVTHNGDLADKYATRIINMLDGVITGDSNPLSEAEAKVLREKAVEKAEAQKAQKAQKAKKEKKLRTRMSFWTAVSLSFKNLLTKRGRTVMTAIAGSIGIISIALVTGLSAGFSNYIDKMQEDTLSSYPLTISQTGVNSEALLTMEPLESLEKFPTVKKVYYLKIMEAMEKLTKANDITQNYIDTVIKPIEEDSKNCFGVAYTYDKPIRVFSSASTAGMHVLVPSSTFTQLVDNEQYVMSQYDILEGRLPSSHDEVVLVVDQYNQFYDVYAKLLGLKVDDVEGVDFEEIMQVTMRVVTDHTLYVEKDGVYSSVALSMMGQSYLKSDYYDRATEEGNYGFDLKIVGILRANEEVATGALSAVAPIAYSHLLPEYLLSLEQNPQTRSPVAQAQIDNPNVDVFSGIAFKGTKAYEVNAKKLGISTLPSIISIYPTSFEAKDVIKARLDQYNDGVEDEAKIQYADLMQAFVSILNTVVDGITYVLVAFIAISLVVSSVMIGVITYTSVLERTKEIGILRSVGARKKDIGMVFNAETIIVGCFSGLLGIGVAYLLSIPLNALLGSLVPISNLVAISPVVAVVLVFVSTFLTFIAGLVPSSYASKKDPVIALRTE